MRLKTYKRAIAQYAEVHDMPVAKVRKVAKHRMRAQMEYYSCP